MKQTQEKDVTNNLILQIKTRTMKIRLKKLSELPNALHPNNINVGFERIFETSKDMFKPPTLEERFNPSSYFSTSGVQEIIDDKTFKTYSSIYEWEILEP